MTKMNDNKNPSFSHENQPEKLHKINPQTTQRVSNNTVIVVVCITICIIVVALASMVLFRGNNNGIVNDSNTNNTCAHLWVNATCSSPKTCSKCNEIEGTVANCIWTEASCSAPKTCLNCKKTFGSALGHKWEKETCTSPQRCSRCNETQGTIGAHYDIGNGKCKYCNQDILLLEMENGFDIKLIIPTVGGMNAYCTVKYTNNTKYTISSDMTYLSANGKLLYNSDAIFTLSPNYYVTATYYRSILPSDRYNSKYYDLYLDNNSLAYTNVIVNGKTVFIKFGSNGPIAFGYSLADIGVY